MTNFSVREALFQTPHIKVMNSRTSLYGALQDSIVDAELLLNAMEPLEFAAHSHLIAATELKETVLLCHPLQLMNDDS